MKYIIEFYKELDTINLIIFWGIIIVILLLLIFSIIIVNKNKKLKRIIINKEQEVEESRNELAIKTEQINFIEKSKKEEPDIHINNQKDIIQNDNIEVSFPIKEENFIAEEYVNNYVDNNNQENNTIIKEEDKTPILPIIEEEPKIEVHNDQINIEKPKEEKKEIIMPTGPYQRNVLREMSLNQTSPIGIIKKDNQHNQDIHKAQELHDTLQNIEIKKDNYENNYQREMHNSKEMINKIYEKPETKIELPKETKVEERIPELELVKPPKKEEIIEEKKQEINNNNYILKENPKEQKQEVKSNNYLKEVSEKLSEAKDNNGIERTEYELKQEEEAIISYEELMKKKDQIQIVDEEDAVISIEELYNKTKSKEKLYNITKEEEDNKFISELKHFRSDL